MEIIQKILNKIKEDVLLYAYFMSLLLVLYGLHYYYGFRYFLPICLYVIAFVVSYFAFKKVLKLEFFKFLSTNKVSLTNENFLLKSLPFVVAFCLVFVVGHFVYLKNIPLLTSYLSLDYYHIALIRQSIKEVDSTFVKYMSAFMLKAIIPFFLMVLLIKNKRLFVVFLVLSIIYALALMQKSYIVGIIVPSLIYSIFKFDYKKIILFIAIAFIGDYILVYVTNPDMRATEIEVEQYLADNKQDYVIDSTVFVNEEIKENGIIMAGEAIFERVFLTTGKIVGYWFDAVPSKLPYANGCGYHFLAPALGCEFEDFDYSRIIYDSIYIKESKKGLKGTVTVACFMYDYANFGIIGLIISAITLALFLNIINHVFCHDFFWIISLNLLYILWLTSAALSTTLLSGGWMLTIFLYFIYRKILIKNE